LKEPEEVSRWGVFALGTVSYEMGNRDLIGQQNPFEALGKLLQTNDTELQRWILNLFAILCHDHQTHRVQCHELLPRVVQLLGSNEEKVIRNAAFALSAICKDNGDNRQLALKEGALNSCLKLLHSESEQVKHWASQAVLQIVQQQSDNLTPELKAIVKEYSQGKHTIAGKRLIDLVDSSAGNSLAMRAKNKLPPVRGISKLFSEVKENSSGDEEIEKNEKEVDEDLSSLSKQLSQ